MPKTWQAFKIACKTLENKSPNQFYMQMWRLPFVVTSKYVSYATSSVLYINSYQVFPFEWIIDKSFFFKIIYFHQFRSVIRTFIPSLVTGGFLRLQFVARVSETQPVIVTYG
jgi:hypothetical protein